MINKPVSVAVAAICLAVGVAIRAAGQPGLSAPEESGTGSGTNDANRTTVITSDRLVFDYGRRYGVFEKNVHVSDDEIKINADRMAIYFSEDDTVKKIVAEGNVKIVQLDRVGTCVTAICDVAKGSLELIGKAEISGGSGVMRGDRIKINRDPGGIDCEPGYFRFKGGGTDAAGLKDFLRDDGKGNNSR